MAKQPQETNSVEEDSLEANSIDNPNSNALPKDSKLPRFNQFRKLLRTKKRLFVKFRRLEKKQKIILFSLVGLVLLILLALGIFSITSSKPSPQVKTKISTPAHKQDEDITHNFLSSLPKVESSFPQATNKDLDTLIQKAQILYGSGNKLEALDIFKSINVFSQSLASYNLGVMQLQQKDYNHALKSFINAINSGEDVSLASLSAAITSRYLGDYNSYAYYLNQATKTLHEENKQPFYSYLYSLINYYNQNYFAALSGLNNPSSQAYVPEQATLGAKVYLIFDDNQKAIQSLESAPDSTRDLKNLGLLYARIGDYSKANELLLEYQKNNPKDLEAKMALELIALKSGDYSSASEILNQLGKKASIQKQAQNLYPIQVVLQPRLFDVDEAQKKFIQKGLGDSGFIADRLLFYYAPFKIFNAEESLEILRQSGILGGSNIVASQQKIVESQTITRINTQITQALIAIYHKDLRKALKVLQDSIDANPNHSILHYDIGVLYAQMNDYQKAYEHFLKSYYLDVNNVDSGLFAILANHFLNRDTERIKLDITQDLDKLNLTSDQKSFFYAFLGYLGNSTTDEMSWIDQTKNPLPIYYALKAAYGLQTKTYKNAYNAFHKLLQFYPDDLVTLTMENLTENPTAEFKQIALKLYKMLVDQRINLDSVYHGPAISREFYVYVGFISGTLKTQEGIIQEKLVGEHSDVAGVLQLLGLLYIYQHKFEQANAVYNTLINQIHENDSQTQFLSAVSSIGTGNYDNAALSLQLSKMESWANYEARFALGLLYQQAGNFKAASSHFDFISNKPFSSEYFDFVIHTDRIIDHMNSEQDSAQ